MFLFLCAMLTPLVVAADDADGVFDPPAILLTWQQDPTSTMTIDWQTLPEEDRPPTVEYRASGETTWQRETGETHEIDIYDRLIHRKELEGLSPGTEYEFRFATDGRIYRFRTFPADNREPVRFVVAGDMGADAWGRAATEMLDYDPEFLAVGGDLSYADGGDKDDHVRRWHRWFDTLKRDMVDRDNRVVPLLASIGNHEVVGAFHHRHEGFEPTDEWRERIAPYYFGFFAFPGHPGYGVLDFGDWMSLILLDTDHAGPMEGAQTRWLEQVLEERREVPHVFPLYHIPAWPSVQEMDRPFDRQVREAHHDDWVPLFERHGVRVSFEKHDHAYKRSHPVRDGEINAAGVVYLGDGAMGVSPREPDPERWYLARAEPKRHVIVATVHGGHQHFLVIDREGRVIDEFPETPGTPKKVFPAVESAPDGTVGHWSFDGDVEDRTPNTNHGAVRGSSAFLAGRAFVDHDLPEGRAPLAFDGEEDFLEIEDIYRFDDDEPFTVVVEFLAEEPRRGEPDVVGKRRNSPHSWAISDYVARDGELRVEFNGENNLRDRVRVRGLEAGQWHKVRVVYEDREFDVYVDEELAATGKYTDSGGFDNAEPITVGRRGSDPGRFFHGRVAELRLYDRAVRPAD